MTTIIHVNRQFIAFNTKYGSILPTYIVRKNNKSYYAYSVEINGPSYFVDPRRHKPLNCGARAWMETTSEVIMTGAMTYQEAIKLKSEYENVIKIRSNGGRNGTE